MYFPIFRGRQSELLALRSCLEQKALSEKIIPVIEPVKVTSTFFSTIDAFIEQGHQVAIIRNPQVGDWDANIDRDRNTSYEERYREQLAKSQVISTYYVTKQLEDDIARDSGDSVDMNSLMFICDNPDSINTFKRVVGSAQPRYDLIPDRSEFRREIRVNRVMCEDHFTKLARNVDYLKAEDEFFSADHLYFKDDGYVGFSDYSIIGKEYADTGFAPYAVAIHIVYFGEDGTLRIRHFVSDSNDDIFDPARKFEEALRKLVRWKDAGNDLRLETAGLRELESDLEMGKYPGLPSIKRYSIMHHLQLVGEYLD